MKISLNFRITALIIFLCGALLPFAFAPLKIWPLAVIIPAILLFFWLENSAKKAFWLGLIFGIGFFGVGVSWVFVSLHRFGNAPILIAGTITALFILVLAGYSALQGLLVNFVCRKYNLRKMLLIFPASTALFEWLRGTLFTGFPWLFLGYSQLNSPLSGFAPIFGIYGVSFFTALTSTILVALYKTKNILTRLLLIAFIIIIWGSGFCLKHFSWITIDSKPIQVTLIQGNVPQELKWQRNEIPFILLRYLQITQKNLTSNIIVWPENAMPVLPDEIPNYLNRLNKIGAEHQLTIVSGMPFWDEANDKYYNAMVAFGQDHALYLKRHLVPFGEYLPLKKLSVPLLKYLSIPASDFSPETNPQPEFKANDLIVAPFICYEIAYPNLVLDYLPRANLLITIADDSWFGDSLAPYQHLQIAQFRSLETGRYQLLGTNSGITAVINPDGSLQKVAPMDQSTALTATIYKTSGKTPWVCFGHYVWQIAAVLMLGLALI